MVAKVNIKYIIDELGTYEEPLLSGYEDRSFYLKMMKIVKCNVMSDRI